VLSSKRLSPGSARVTRHGNDHLLFCGFSADDVSPHGTDVPIVLPLAAAGPKRNPSRWYQDMACVCCSKWHGDHDHNISPGQRARQAAQAQSVSALAVCTQSFRGVLHCIIQRSAVLENFTYALCQDSWDIDNGVPCLPSQKSHLGKRCESVANYLDSRQNGFLRLGPHEVGTRRMYDLAGSDRLVKQELLGKRLT
jgi:hypothetical protein